mgnify:CR=1 FL=1
MDLLDPILPPNLHPYLKYLINGLVIFHILAFLFYIFILVRSYVKERNQKIDDDLSDDEYEKKQVQKKK